MKLLYHLLAIATVCIWGTTFVSTKILLQAGLTPAEIFFLRFLMAYLILRLYTPKTPQSKPSVKEELQMLGLGITGGSLYFLTENQALQYAPASNVSLLVCTTPLLTLLLTRLVFRSDRLSLHTLCGSLLALFGVALVVLDGHFTLHLNPKGDLLALSASLLWAIYTLLLRSLEERGRFSNLYLTRKVFGYGLLTILPYFLWQPPHFDLATLALPTVWGNLLFLGLIASLLCYATWNAVVKHLGTTQSSHYLYLNPLAASLAAALILGERLTPVALSGAALILLGIAWARHKR
ncbi:MAG: DMT family transporter [Alistipes sp.]|nr:DMT family transporter [Alistipes sp.]